MSQTTQQTGTDDYQVVPYVRFIYSGGRNSVVCLKDKSLADATRESVGHEFIVTYDRLEKVVEYKGRKLILSSGILNEQYVKE